MVFIVRLTCRADPARSALLGSNRYSRCVKNNKTSTSREVTPDTALAHHNNARGTRKARRHAGHALAVCSEIHPM